MKACEECGKPIEGNKGKRFCSSACQQRNARKRKNGERPPKECPTCHKFFEPYNSQQVYCSENCRPNKKISNLTPVKCAVCHEYFTPVNRFQRFCSQKCRDVEKKAKAEKKKRFCIWCGAEFVPKSVGQKYCGGECRNAANNEREKTRKIPHTSKVCEICGKAFVQRSITQKYCGKNCRDNALARGSKKPYPIDGKNRPFTRDTVWLCCLYYQRGESIGQIAYDLNRSEQSVLKALREGGEQV